MWLTGDLIGWDNTTPGGGPCKDVGVKGDIADAGAVKTNHGLRFCGTLSLDQYSGLHNNNNSFFIKLFKFILHFLPYNDTAKEIWIRMRITLLVLHISVSQQPKDSSIEK